MTEEEFRTKQGHLLSEEDLRRLAAEAEAGYDVEQQQQRWPTFSDATLTVLCAQYLGGDRSVRKAMLARMAQAFHEADLAAHDGGEPGDVQSWQNPQ